MWTEGQRWPEDRADAARWVQARGYAQFTQAAESTDGLSFRTHPAITKQSYLRVFRHQGTLYGMARLGQMLRASDPLEVFEPGASPFAASPYAARVRHVALLPDGGTLHVFFSAIGDAPEEILHTTIALEGDWRQWRIGAVDKVLQPEAPYECTELPNVRSEVGEIDRPARQLRDPAVINDGGTTYLFYTFCGEQGIAGAEIRW